MLAIASISKSLEDGIKRKTANFGGLSSLVGTTGFEPVTLPTKSRDALEPAELSFGN